MTKRPDIERDSVSIVLPPVATGLATWFGVLPASLTGVGLAAGILGLLAYDSITRRTESFCSAFRREIAETNTGDIDETIHERSRDPQFRNTAFHALRQLRDAMADAAAPAIAVLLSEYTARPGDAFFRNAGDLLCALSAAEYEELWMCTDGILAVLNDNVWWSPGLIVALTIRTSSIYVVSDNSQGTAIAAEAHIDRLQVVPALFDLLRRCGFARERPNVDATCELDALRRLHSILRRARR